MTSCRALPAVFSGAKEEGASGVAEHGERLLHICARRHLPLQTVMLCSVCALTLNFVL